MRSALHASYAIMELLVAAGADVELKTPDGKLLQEIMVRLLKKNGRGG